MTVEELIAKHRGLPGALARKLAPRHLREDAAGAGRVGLLEAATRFDPKRGVGFGSFAYYRVVGEIQTFLANERHHAHPPTDATAPVHCVTSDSRFDVAAILARLPPRERAVLTRAYLHGLTQTRAAEIASKSHASRLVHGALRLAREAAE